MSFSQLYIRSTVTGGLKHSCTSCMNLSMIMHTMIYEDLHCHRTHGLNTLSVRMRAVRTLARLVA